MSRSETGRTVPTGGEDGVNAAPRPYGSGRGDGEIGRPEAAGPSEPGALTPYRRRSADPVRSLMRQHWELCERAVDPLEIAAGLEAQGVTDRTAARFRHRDVFSLAEELYARVPRAEGRAPDEPAPKARSAGTVVVQTALHLLPGAVCAATAAAFAATEASAPGADARPAVAAVGGAFTLLALGLCLRGGPLRIRAAVPGSAGTRVGRIGRPVVSVLLGGGLPTVMAVGWSGDGAGVSVPWPLPSSAVGVVVALACAVLPAAGCAGWFAVRGRREVTACRGPDEFAGRMRTALVAAVVAFLGSLLALSTAAGTITGGGTAGTALTAATSGSTWACAAVGTLLFLARLLDLYGFPVAACAGPAAAVAVGAAATTAPLALRVPDLAPPARPVEAAATALGPHVLPVLGCGAATLGLLLYGLHALTRATAHRPVHRPEAVAERP
ncbi:hypothetical protein [Streptomyces sp. NPDC003077]|uniref:hypothetical protein n=1 Tax=Streptomyces sp. NPDC003077 TaxID=3154443 RepID=UPI0033BDA0D0